VKTFLGRAGRVFLESGGTGELPAESEEKRNAKEKEGLAERWTKGRRKERNSDLPSPKRVLLGRRI